MTPEFAMTSDAQLVAASRSGDRSAFEQIVRRYQSMVSGLIYASCGDLHRSEDVAQETFVSAWQKLGGLRDPARLAGWLCQIARSRLADSHRGGGADLRPLADAEQSITPDDRADPQHQTLSEEERSHLWHTLSQLPEPYRQTLALYRLGQSTATVAAATNTSEANVRQRLARGRELLREDLLRQVERDLVRSRPGPVFTLSVMASLPLAAQAGLMAAGPTAGKGVAALKGASLLWPVIFWPPGLLGLGVGVAGSWHNIRQAQSRRERRLVVWLTAIF
jgi:RNA polymerase sigma factor (sigma-70 family)